MRTHKRTQLLSIMINYKAIQQPLATPVQRSLPINKLCGRLEALPNRLVLHFLLMCWIGINRFAPARGWCAVGWLEDVTHRGEAWLCVLVYDIMCDLLPYCIESILTFTHTTRPQLQIFINAYV